MCACGAPLPTDWSASTPVTVWTRFITDSLVWHKVRAAFWDPSNSSSSFALSAPPAPVWHVVNALVLARIRFRAPENAVFESFWASLPADVTYTKKAFVTFFIAKPGLHEWSFWWAVAAKFSKATAFSSLPASFWAAIRSESTTWSVVILVILVLKVLMQLLVEHSFDELRVFAGSPFVECIEFFVCCISTFTKVAWPLDEDLDELLLLFIITTLKLFEGFLDCPDFAFDTTSKAGLELIIVGIANEVLEEGLNEFSCLGVAPLHIHRHCGGHRAEKES